ncbi:hypothetical protein CAter282_3727 [Collimonas arenae]|uniref:Phage virion morphogenesis protein n=1 Tax=Collimonas arenae TaxID=279058 RepID=A0A127QMV7_9BURK|nr:hypothetical protein CAter10_4074 [Collimonas arenae]AMP11408.1 hypothetical protein CAter282_3727 [Collimonas arenae]
MARIARMHQERLTNKVSKKRPEYRHPSGLLLGFSANDQTLIRDALLYHIGNF